MRIVFLAIAVFVFIGSALAGEPLRVSLSPLLGSLPVLFGEEWGLFAEEGLELEIVQLPSQMSRAAAFQVGRIDAMVTDVATAVLLAAQAQPLVVGTAYLPEDPSMQFALLIESQADLSAPTPDEVLEELMGRNSFTVAVPLKSDAEFALDSLFTARGYTPPPQAYFGHEDLIFTVILAASRNLDAAIFPQPYASYLIPYAGGELGMDLVAVTGFEVLPLPHLIIFRRWLAEDKPEVVRAFLRAFRAATARLNQAEQEELIALGARVVVNLFMPGIDPEQALANPSVQAGAFAIPIPHFPEPGLPDPEVLAAVSDWALKKGYISRLPTYERLVTGTFLE
jgi:NitT/TauT family transport system substrate-binding protein